MNKFELDYKRLLSNAYESGTIETSRAGDVVCSFNKSMTINIAKKMPILTGRKIFFEKAFHEYRWIKEGLRTTKYLKDNNIHWWDAFADDNGDLGKTYGYQFRNFNGEIDQLEYINFNLKVDKYSRRNHVTLWNPSELNETKLPPCYTGFTFMTQGNKLNMSVQFRSSDLLLGLPYDILVMYFMLIEIAEFNNLIPNKLGLQITNAHIYKNQEIQLFEYLNRPIHKSPILMRDKNGNYFLTNYVHEEHIQIPLNI